MAKIWPEKITSRDGCAAAEDRLPKPMWGSLKPPTPNLDAPIAKSQSQRFQPKDPAVLKKLYDIQSVRNCLPTETLFSELIRRKFTDTDTDL